MKLINLIPSTTIVELVNSRNCARLLVVPFDRTLDALEIYKRHLIMSYKQTPIGPTQIAYNFKEESISIIRYGESL